MKKRIGHVTNSSSTSYVLTTKEPLPTKYADMFKRIEKENLAELFKQRRGYYFDNDDSVTNQIKEIGNFTDEQMDFITIIQYDMLYEYLHIRKRLAEIEDPIYHLYVDRDYLYCAEELDHFVHHESTIIDEEHDL